MSRTKRTLGGEALTSLVLDVLRVNSLLLTAGDRLVEGLGLTSARWQILGAIRSAERPQPVAWLARNLGANRQNVQRITNDLHKEGLVAFEPNPHHRRAQLVVLTAKGRQTLDEAGRLQVPWINSLSNGLSIEDIETAHHVMMALRKKLERNDEREERTLTASESRALRERDVRAAR
jgi:DNA-binding MarR family transcriptional regulator